MDPVVLDCFYREFVKVGLNLSQVVGAAKGLLSRAGGIGSGAALGTVGGGVLGAGVGAYRGATQAQEQGGSGVVGGITGAIGGARTGAMMGAGVGGIAGGVAGPAAAKALAARQDAIGTVSRFGQRQAHGFTGWTPEGFANRSEAIRSIGGGGHDIAKQVKGLESQVAAAATPEAAAKLLKKRDGLQKGLDYATKAEEQGLTSIPGLFRGLATKPGETMQTMAGHAWNANPTVTGKALAFGLPAASLAAEAARPSQEGEGSRLSRVGTSLATSLPSMTPLGFVAGSTLGAGAQLGIHGAEGLAHKLIPPRRPQAPPVANAPAAAQQAAEGSTAVPHEMSDRAKSVAPTGWS